MYKVIYGDVFAQPVDAYLITVNCVGAMGRGIALTAKNTIPGIYQSYRQACRDKKIKPGTIGEYTHQNKRYLLAATKDHFKDPSKRDWLENILSTLAQQSEKRGVTSIAIPPLGCGNGLLNFDKDLVPLLDRYLATCPTEVLVCR